MTKRSQQRWPQFLLSLAVIAAIAGLASTVTSEIVMAPTTEQRNELISLLVAIAAVALGTAVVFSVFGPRSLTRRLLVAAISGPLVIGAALAFGSRSMFISSDDLPFLLIVFLRPLLSKDFSPKFPYFLDLFFRAFSSNLKIFQFSFPKYWNAKRLRYFALC